MWVGEGSEPVVLLLSGGIPESEVDHFAIDLNSGGVVIKNGGYVFGGESVLSVAESFSWVPDEEASFTDAAVTDYNELNGDGVL